MQPSVDIENKENQKEYRTIVTRRVQRRGPTILARIAVNQIETDAVLDTGSEVTIISEEFGRRNRFLQEGERVKLLNAEDGSCMYGISGVIINIKLGDTLLQWPVVVAPIRDDVLLGLDYLYEVDAHFTGRGVVKIDGKIIPTKMVKEHEEEIVACSVVCARVTVEIPPNTEIVVEGEIPSDIDFDIGMVETRTISEGLQTASAVVSKKGQIPVRMINWSSENKLIKKGEELGSLHIISPADVETFEVKQLSASEQENSHLDGLLGSLNSLPEDQKKLTRALLIKYADVFARNDLDLGEFKEIKHRIDTGDARPIRQPVRRTPLGFENEEEEYLQKLLESGVIRPSTSEWAAPIVLVRKKDGGVRWCIDYRRLNTVTRGDSYPLPKIEECLDTISGSTLFSTLDLQSGYYQIRIDERDIEKTAFITKYGLYEHLRLPMGIKTSPSTFSRAMSLVLSGLQWKTLLIYLDDVIVVAHNFSEHLERLEEVLVRFRQFGLKLKPKKCQIMKKEVVFLGHIVNGEGVQVNPELTKVITEWKTPRNVKELQSFIGLCNYYRKYVKDFAVIATPLNQLMKKGTPYRWMEKQDEAFLKLKELLTNTPILAYPRAHGMFILDTDASNQCVGAVLSQIQDGKEVVIAYASLTLEAAQKKYCVTRKELLAVIKFTRQFRHYLLGRKFLLRTDHGSLAWLFRFKAPVGQLARWLEEVSQYSFDILHRPGIKHANADALSRPPEESCDCDCYKAGNDVTKLPCGGCPYCTKIHQEWAKFVEDVDDVIPLAIRQIQNEEVEEKQEWFPKSTPEEMQELQRKDKDLKPLFEWFEKDDRPSRNQIMIESPAVRNYWRHWNRVRFKDGVLFYKWENDDGTTGDRLIIPSELKGHLLYLAHDSLCSGHMGTEKTTARLKRQCYWYGMWEDVKLYIKTCAECQINNPPNFKNRAAYRGYHTGNPMDRVHLDIAGPFPKSKDGHKYILVIMDQFTKWVEAFPIPNQTAGVVVEKLLEFILRLGFPVEIHTDQGRNFESELFKSVCKVLNVTKTRTTPYRPSSNGQVERFNRTLLKMMRCYVDSHQDTWDRYLPFLTSAYRSSVHTVTGFTPNQLMLIRETRNLCDLEFEMETSKDEDVQEFISRTTSTAKEVHSLAREHLKASQVSQKKAYDMRKRVNTYGVGDLVLLRDLARRKGFSPKLQPAWKGPLVIKEILAPDLYRITSKKGDRVLHHDAIKPYHASVLPMNIRKMRHKVLNEEVPQNKETRRQDDVVKETTKKEMEEESTGRKTRVCRRRKRKEKQKGEQEPETGFTTRTGRLIKKPERLAYF